MIVERFRGMAMSHLDVTANRIQWSLDPSHVVLIIFILLTEEIELYRLQMALLVMVPHLEDLTLVLTLLKVVVFNRRR